MAEFFLQGDMEVRTFFASSSTTYIISMCSKGEVPIESFHQSRLIKLLFELIIDHRTMRVQKKSKQEIIAYGNQTFDVALVSKSYRDSTLENHKMKSLTSRYFEELTSSKSCKPCCGLAR